MTQITRLTLDEDGGGHRLKETKTDLDAPLETVGQDLRSARLARGQDLADVSGVLKIRKEHLVALEEDKIELLPGRTYAVGFIRSYATYLGLDPVQYVERFKAEIAGRNEMAPPPVDVIEEDEQKKLPQGWWAIAGVVLLLVLYGAYQLMAAADKAIREQVNEPPALEASAPPVPKPVKMAPPPPPVQVQSDEAGTLTTKPEDAGTANATNPANPTNTANTALPAVNGANPAAPHAVPQQAKPAAPPPLPQGQVFGAMNKNPHVIIRALQSTRVLVEGPGGKIFILKVLKAGDIYQVPNLPGLKLTAANAEALDILLDGQYVGRVGRGPDAIEAVSLDPQAIANRYRH